MKNNKFISLSLIFTTILVIPSVQAVLVYDEPFTQYDDLSLPCLPTPVSPGSEPCAGYLATDYNTVGAIDFHYVSLNGANKMLFFRASATDNDAQAIFDTHKNLCDAPNFFEIDIGSSGADPPEGSLFIMTALDPSIVGPPALTYNKYTLEFSTVLPGQGKVALHMQTYEDGSLVSGITTAAIIYTVSYSATTMYKFFIECHNSSASTEFGVFSFDSGNSALANTVANGGSSFVPDEIWTANSGSGAATHTQFYDNVIFDYPEGVPDITPSATSAAYSTIHGFDITKDGTSAIIRYGSGTDSVVTLFGSVLTEEMTPVATNCNRLHGVVGLQDEGFGYIGCNGGFTPDTMNFIAPDGSLYPVSNCNRTGDPFSLPNDDQICDGTFDISSIPDRASLIDIVPSTPGITTLKSSGTFGAGIYNNFYYLIFSESATYNTAIFDYRFVALGESSGGHATENGEEVNTVQTTDGGNTDICGFGNLKAFRTNTGTPVVEIDSSYHVVFPSHIIPASNQITGFGSGALADGSYIDCASDRFIVNSPTNLKIYNYNTNTVVLNQTISGGSYNTISGNGSYAAYSDGTITHVFNGLTGTVLANITNPAALIDMEMDQCAQILFLVTNTRVYEYDIHDFTTINPVSIGSGCIVGSGIGGSSSSNTNAETIIAPTPTNPSLTGVCTDDFVCDADGNDNHFWFGVNKTTIASDFGVTESKFNWMIGLLLIITIVLGVAAFITRSIILFGITALLGLGASVTFGLIPVWFLLLLIFLVIILAVRLMFGSGGGE